MEEEFVSVPTAKAELCRIFPGEDVDAIVEVQPWMLIENINHAISDFQRCGADECIEDSSFLVSGPLIHKLGLW